MSAAAAGKEPDMKMLVIFCAVAKPEEVRR